MIRKVAAAVLRLWIVPVVLVVWELTTSTLGSFYFPPPTKILAHMGQLWFSGPPSQLWLNDTALSNFPHSIRNLLTGWVVSGIAGVVVGLALGRSPLFFRFLDPIIQFGRALPPPALLPLFVALFSTGTRMQVTAIMFGIIWPVLFNAADGARNVDPLHLETARVFRLSRTQRLFRVILPSAMPKIFAGLRLSLSLALILMVIAETFSTVGIGYQLRLAERNYEPPGVWGAIIVLGVLGFLFNQVFVTVERRVLVWHSQATRRA